MTERDDNRAISGGGATAKRVTWGLVALSAVVLLLDVVVYRKAETSIDAIPFFYGVYGFACAVVVVLVAGFILRGIVRRREDYYDD